MATLRALLNGLFDTRERRTTLSHTHLSHTQPCHTSPSNTHLSHLTSFFAHNVPLIQECKAGAAFLENPWVAGYLTN